MAATVLRPGEGEALSKYVELKLGCPEITICEFRYPPGRKGPVPHIHLEHADGFFALEGQLSFVLGPNLEDHVVGPGSFVLAPPEVVHTFRNDGPEEAHFLNIHAPGKGFDNYMRAARDGADTSWFDSIDHPDGGGRPLAEALVVGPGDGVKAGPEQRPGGLAVAVIETGPGLAEPPRSHDHGHAGFYVLEGTLTLALEDGDVDVAAGSFATVPPGTEHGLANRDEAPLRVLAITAPPGPPAM